MFKIQQFQDEQINTSSYSENINKEKIKIQKLSLKVILNYIISDISKKPRSFKIGLFTTYIVVTFLGLLQCVVQLSPLVFLQLAETSAGDTDIQFLPKSAENSTNEFQLINMTKLEKLVNEIPDFYGISSRWMMISNLKSNKSSNTNLKSYFLILDSAQENSLGIGRRLDTDNIDNNSVYVTETALRGLNMSIGDEVQININFVQLLKTFGFGDKLDHQQIKELLTKILLNDMMKYDGKNKIFSKEYKISELQEYAQQYETYARAIEITSFTKSLAKNTAKQNLKSYKLDENQIELGNQIIDFVFERNMTKDAVSLNRFFNRVSLFQTTLSLKDIIFGMTDILIELLEFDINCKIYGTITQPKGKWADSLGMVAYMDEKNATSLIMEAITKKLNIVAQNYQYREDITGALAQLIPQDDTYQLGQNLIQDIKLKEYTLLGNAIYKNRGYIYQDPNTVKDNLIETSNQFFKNAGYNYPVTITSPLGLSIKVYHLMKNFIENLLGVATMILLMLSILLIYSLMIGDVDEKTYEFGMLRALGFQKSWLIILLLIQGLIFAIPGLALGLLTCYLLNSFVSMTIFDMSLLETSYSIPLYAQLFSVFLGLIIPLISNILPIQKALSKTLRDSLDIFHRVINDIYITVVKLEKLGISTSQTGCAILLITAGFISYYWIPMSIIFQNLKSALILLNLIFIVMVIGITVLVNLFQQQFEKVILYIILLIYPKDRNLYQIILNNLHSHGNRNFKTTLMYSLGLAFIIFTGAQFALQTEFMNDFIKTSLTSDIIIFDGSLQQYGLDEYKFRLHLEQEQQVDPTFIKGFTFSALQLNDMPIIPNFFWISPLAYFPRRRLRLHGIEKNYLDVITNEYYYPTEYDTNQKDIRYLNTGVRDGVYDLYNRENSLDIPKESDVYNVISNIQVQKSYYTMLEELKEQDRQKNHKPKKLQQLNQKDQEINIIIPEGYRYEGAISVNTPSLIRIFREHGRVIEHRVKVKHMASKLPNNDFSGYRTIALYGEGLITMDDALKLTNEILQAKIEDGIYGRGEHYFSQLPKNLTYGLPKDILLIKFNRTTTLEERTDFCNRLRNYFTNDQTYIFDSITMQYTSKDFFDYIQLFNSVVATIALTLSFFLLLVSFIANVRNNSWEIGVLRAIGLTKSQISRVFVYEATCLIISSGLIGTAIGIVIATTFTFQMVAFSEFHFRFAFPISTFLLTFIGGIIISLWSSYLAVKSLSYRSIALILKGQN